jgi:hypothetical protein
MDITLSTIIVIATPFKYGYELELYTDMILSTIYLDSIYILFIIIYTKFFTYLLCLSFY